MRLILKGAATVLATTAIIAIWTVCIKTFLNPRTDYVFAGMLVFVAFVMTIVTLIVWSGIIIAPAIKKSKKSK